jgi:type 1 glutamine amidotransferase
MTRTAAVLLTFSLVLTAGMSAQAPQTTGGGEGDARALRVLVTVGGHGYEEAPFHGMLDALPGVTWKMIQLPEEADLLKPGLERQYDAILMYDMVPGISPAQQKAFLDLINTKIGLVSLHHNVGAHRDWDEWPKVVGGRWIHEKTKVMDGTTYLQTHAVGLNEPVTLKIHVDPSHPISKGVQDFVTRDEFYVGLYIAPTITPLLTSDHIEARLDRGLFGWTHMYNETRVFYMRLGHFSTAWNDPQWRKLMVQGLRWSACTRHQAFC